MSISSKADTRNPTPRTRSRATSLRKAINAKCTDCIHDSLAAGTRLQQITLCSSYGCPLWEVRPVTKSPIPKSVLSYYGIEPDDLYRESILDAHTGPKRALLRANGSDPSTAMSWVVR